MILGDADVSFFCVLFWGQPDSGLICLVLFLLNSNEIFEFSFGGEEGRKGGGEEGREEGR